MMMIIRNCELSGGGGHGQGPGSGLGVLPGGYLPHPPFPSWESHWYDVAQYAYFYNINILGENKTTVKTLF